MWRLLCVLFLLYFSTLHGIFNIFGDDCYPCFVMYWRLKVKSIVSSNYAIALGLGLLIDWCALTDNLVKLPRIFLCTIELSSLVISFSFHRPYICSRTRETNKTYGFHFPLCSVCYTKWLKIGVPTPMWVASGPPLLAISKQDDHLRHIKYIFHSEHKQ